MITRIKISILALTLILSIGAIALPSTVSAQGNEELCSGANLSLSGDSKDCKKDETKTKADNTIKRIINIISTLIGIIAVVMIIFGGFKYITSGGDSAKLTSAKDTILYAIIGLIIVALAQVIVRFVLSKV